jgi:hypothetical protein
MKKLAIIAAMLVLLGACTKEPEPATSEAEPTVATETEAKTAATPDELAEAAAEAETVDELTLMATFPNDHDTMQGMCYFETEDGSTLKLACTEEMVGNLYYLTPDLYHRSKPVKIRYAERDGQLTLTGYSGENSIIGAYLVPSVNYNGESDLAENLCRFVVAESDGAEIAFNCDSKTRKAIEADGSDINGDSLLLRYRVDEKNITLTGYDFDYSDRNYAVIQTDPAVYDGYNEDGTCDFLMGEWTELDNGNVEYSDIGTRLATYCSEEEIKYFEANRKFVHGLYYYYVDGKTVEIGCSDLSGAISAEDQEDYLAAVSSEEYGPCH